MPLGVVFLDRVLKFIWYPVPTLGGTTQLIHVRRNFNGAMPPKIRLDAKPHLSDDDRDREAESNRLALLSPRSSTERLFVTGTVQCHPI